MENPNSWYEDSPVPEQYVDPQQFAAQYTAQFGTAQLGAAQFGTAQSGAAQYGKTSAYAQVQYYQSGGGIDGTAYTPETQFTPQTGASAAVSYGAAGPTAYGGATKQGSARYPIQKYPSEDQSSMPIYGHGGEEGADEYLSAMETNMKSNDKPPSSVQEITEKPMSLQDRLSALANDQTVTAAENPRKLTDEEQLGPVPKKLKVITKDLDPSMFQTRKKSRFDLAPTSSPFATGANAIPVGAKPTVVLNKYSISSQLKTTKKGAKKVQPGGMKPIPENTCTVDMKMQRAIMQEVAGMKEFKFTIGINKMYKGIIRNQKNKKKGHPLKLDEEIDIDSLVEYCEDMTHLLRVKKKKYIKVLPHVTPYIMAGVNLWAMFHGRATRRTIRDNWDIWIGKPSPIRLGMTWDFYFQIVRTCYMSCDKKQRHKYRSRAKGLERFMLRQVMWTPNKSAYLEKMIKELKCEFAIKKMSQQFINWKNVIKNMIQRSRILIIQQPGDFVTFHQGLRHLLQIMDSFMSTYRNKVTWDNIDRFERELSSYCENVCGYSWEKWGISMRFLVKLYNCMNSSIHRPDARSRNPIAIQMAFKKVFKPGFTEFKLPVQHSKLGENTVPSMVKRELLKRKRREEKLEIRKLEAQLAAIEEQKKREEEKKEEEKRKALEIEQNTVPSNEDYLKQFVEPKPKPEEEVKEEEDVVKVKEINLGDISDDPDDTFNFEPVYTYRQYIQPVESDVLYSIPEGTRVEDEIKLRVEKQNTTPGVGYGLALSDTKNSVLFVFYPFGKTMRVSHFANEAGKHHHRVYGDFMAANADMFQLTIKVKRNRFEVMTDDLCIKTVPAFLSTTNIQTVMFSGGENMPFVNFRIRSISPSLPLIPYLVKRRHQKGLLVDVFRHKDHGLTTKIGKIGGDCELFVKHLSDMLTAVTGTAPTVTVISTKVVWVTGHFKNQITTWLKTIGF